jgi:hypothetical protein
MQHCTQVHVIGAAPKGVLWTRREWRLSIRCTACTAFSPARHNRQVRQDEVRMKEIVTDTVLYAAPRRRCSAERRPVDASRVAPLHPLHSTRRVSRKHVTTGKCVLPVVLLGSCPAHVQSEDAGDYYIGYSAVRSSTSLAQRRKASCGRVASGASPFVAPAQPAQSSYKTSTLRLLR